MSTHTIKLLILVTLLISAPAISKTYYVVAMGDSMTSGEGAPDVRANRNDGIAVWRDDPLCHRSFASYATKAIKKIRAEMSEVDSIEYKNFACSGATINEGIVGSQRKRLSTGGLTPIEPQVEQVKAWMQEKGIDKLDAIIMSVGINDINFAELVKQCVNPIQINCTSKFLKKMKGPLRNVSTFYKSNLKLALEIRLKPENIFVMEYPHPLRGADSQYCHHYDDGYSIFSGGPIYLGDVRLPIGGAVSNVSRSEANSAFTGVITNINMTTLVATRINKVSSESNWQYVGGIVDATKDHGYCAGSRRYFNHFKDSNNKQGDLNGSLHPNDNGYSAIGDVLLEKIKPIFSTSTIKRRPQILRTVVKPRTKIEPPM